MTVHIFAGDVKILPSIGDRMFERTRITNPTRSGASTEAGELVRARRSLQAAAVIPEPDPNGNGIRWRIFTASKEATA